MAQAADSKSVLDHQDMGAHAISICDPKAIIFTYLSGEKSADNSAREVLFAWLMTLPGGMEPDQAAGTVLDNYASLIRDCRPELAFEICELLDQVRQFSRKRQGRMRHDGISRRRPARLH